jgi:hypothetical protein
MASPAPRACNARREFNLGSDGPETKLRDLLLEDKDLVGCG